MGPGAITEAPNWRRTARLLARLPIYLADARARPAWTFMFIFGRFVWARRLSAAFSRAAPDAATLDTAAPYPPASAAGDQPLAAAAVASVVEALRRDGIFADLRLPPALAAEIRAFAEVRPCYGSMDRRMPFPPAEHADAERRYGRKILVGHLLDTVQECRAIAGLVESPWLRAVAAGYLRAPPKNIATRLWWSFPSTDPTPADLSLASQDGFHFDLDDWRQLKFFFYLTDVDHRNGPHVFVRGSHARRPLSHQFTLFVGKSEAEIVAAYGAAAVQTLTGPAGTGFVEDPFGFHTGTTIREGRRLVLEISYGVSDLLRRRRFGEIAP